MRSSLSILILVLVGARMPAQREIRAHYGTDAARLGLSLAGAGDLDSDGYADYVLGAPRAFSRAGSVQAFSGRTGQSLWLVTGHVGNDREFASALAGGADLDKDGIPDVVVGAARADGVSRACGMVFVLSGKDGRRLGEVSGQWENDGFGTAVALLGDQDRDGTSEIGVGAWRAPAGNMWGVAYVFSGRTLALLRLHSGPSTTEHLGRDVGGVGDVNADGVPDYLISAPYRYATAGRGVVLVLSGKDGSRIHELTVTGSSNLGNPAAALGDVDGDGVTDIGARHASLAVFSGKTGAVLFDIASRKQNDDFASSFCAAGDADRDGVLDLCVGAPERDDAPGYATVYSGKTRSELYSIQRGTVRGRFGLMSASLGDVDRNGHEDFALAAPDSGNESGSVFIFDGSKTSLSVDVQTLSLTAGGTQKLDLDAGLLHASKLYFLLGSMTSATPGIRVGRYLLPLVPDAYFTLTLGNPNLPPLSGSLGFLDSTGKAVARFTLPPKSPSSLLFLGLQHAYVVLSPPLAFDFASNPGHVFFVE